MTVTGGAAAVTGLADLGAESRVIATPWSRMVRGIGLGQHPVAHDGGVAALLRRALEMLQVKLGHSHAYTLFAIRLTALILDITDPAITLSRRDVDSALDSITATIRAVPNPYHRLMAGCILMDAASKLNLDVELLLAPRRDVPTETLAALDAIRPNGIADENRGRHGDYERLSASTAVFLAHAQLGLGDRLTTRRDHVGEALDLLDRVPSPFFRGRGGSMLFSVLSLMGLDERVHDGPVDYVARTFDCLDRADELPPPVFPNPMTASFSRTYPLVTMLNAVAMSGRDAYLQYGGDRLDEIADLMARLAPVERTHMGLYYVIALNNLGRLESEIPSLDTFVEGVVGQWRQIDPGDGFFLNGIAYPYMIQTAMVTGRMDLVTDETVRRLVESFPDLDRTDFDRTNRPYPLSYTLNILGEIGKLDSLYTPSDRYDGESALPWVIGRLSHGGVEEGSRMTMIGHALVSAALRLRGPGSTTALFSDFRFPLADRSTALTKVAR